MKTLDISRVRNTPSKAGDAILEWDVAIKNPERKGKRIFIPYGNRISFHPILNGKQFILIRYDYTLDRDRQGDSPNWYHDVFFGGTDEKPFLVQLQKDIFPSTTKPFFSPHFGSPNSCLISDVNKQINTKTEKDFLEMLKPSEIKKLEKKHSTVAKRQGDWFAIRTHFTWDDVTHYFKLHSNLFDKSKPAPLKEESTKLAGTRHRLSGTALETGDCIYAQGVLKAPDHKDMDISNNVHILHQASWLFDPKKAD